jgi:hypothetical protein
MGGNIKRIEKNLLALELEAINAPLSYEK